MTTAYYTRVSTDTQDPGRQVEEIRDHLGEAAFRDARAYADVASGTEDDREEFQQLWQDIEAGEIDRVVTWEMSRLSRRLSTAADFMESCAQTGTALETLNDMFPNLHGGGEDDIWDELMAKFSAWMMEFEREMTRERVRSGVRKAIDEGKWVGRPPYGFETDDAGYLRVKVDEYIRMQLAIEEVLFNDESVNSVANQYRVPQSTLNRVVDDEERRNLYLYGEGNDDRLTSAVEEGDIEDKGELSDLRKRIEALEDQVSE